MMLVFALAVAATQPVPVTAELLAGLPKSEASFTAHGNSQTCTGPTLASVIGKIGVPTGNDVRGEALATGIIARARDGYTVLFSIGELDVMLGASKAIIASRCDGKAISPEDGPYRLVVPGERRAARSVRQLESLTVQR
jgi:hypothetical protein